MCEVKDIYVFVEQRNQEIQEVSFELIGEARRLVEQIKHVKYKVVAVLLGHGMKNECQALIAHGADTVIYMDHDLLTSYTTEAYTKGLEKVIRQFNPDAFLIGATVTGRDLAPRIAARVDTGLTADATHLAIDQETENSTLLLVTRPAFGGNLFGTIVCEKHRPQMASIRPKVFEPLTKDETRTGEVIELDVDLKQEEIHTKLIEVIKKEQKGLDISKSEIIISGGRGVCKHFNLLQEVADELGAAVGASRAAVDEGFATKEIQVGQTGKTVRPKIYIACGISGAVQHIAGMDKSDFIIAINKDPEAPILSVANLGIVGDAVEILPLLKDELKRLRA
jgi:electron transfer flavoprotein alpha subunit